MTDTELLDYIQVSPNPRLQLVLSAWLKTEGGLSIRGNIEYVANKYPNAGFEEINITK